MGSGTQWCPFSDTKHNQKGNRIKVRAGHSIHICWTSFRYHALCLLLKLKGLMEYCACHSLQLIEYVKNFGMANKGRVYCLIGEMGEHCSNRKHKSLSQVGRKWVISSVVLGEGFTEKTINNEDGSWRMNRSPPMVPGIKGIPTRQRDEKACVVGHAHEVFTFPFFLFQEFLAQATISVNSFWFILEGCLL